MKLQILSFIAALVSIPCFSQGMIDAKAPFVSNSSPKREVRAVWLTTIGGLDWPRNYANGSRASIAAQKEELRNILDKLQRGGINTVLLQTRIRGTVIYPSLFEPWDGCMSGKPGVSPGYDPLSFCIDECHRRGMELHAWIVTIPVGKWKGLGCATLRKKSPSLLYRIGDEGYMNPENPDTRDAIADICEEITANYDIDGIHLDYIRYPETWRKKVVKDNGRGYITDIVRKIYYSVKSIKPWVKMSCSPIGKYNDLPQQSSKGWNAYSRVYQDAQRWMREGLMDMLFPMMYFRDNDFYPFAFDWKEQAAGRIVAPGLGIYFMSPRERDWDLQVVSQQMEILRQWGMGHTYFRSRFFTDNLKGIYSFAKDEFDWNLALVPAITWESNVCPEAPQAVGCDSARSVLYWEPGADRSNGPYLTYNVYCSSTWPVDITNSSNLVAVRVKDRQLTVPLNGRFYAVTAMDRYGNESHATQNITLSRAPEMPSAATRKEILPLLHCDGITVTLPNEHLNKSDLINIETMQGTAVKSMFNSRTLSVSDLPEGFYQIRAICRKKASHRLGYFKIDRQGDR